jgi:16S rRNA (cytosine967-C5)-methyltransferase
VSAPQTRHFRPRSRTPREIALEILFHVDTRKAFADLQLNQALGRADLDPRDAALVTELVNGTVRWRGRLDWILGEHVKSGLDTLNPWVRNALRMGLYQILFLDRVPPHAAVDESVKLAKKHGNPGVAGLVNAVLRRLLRDGPAGRDPETVLKDPVLALAVATSHPEWLVARWVRRYGTEEARRLLDANNRTPALGLRVNPLRTDRETLRRALEGAGVPAEATKFSRDTLRVDGRLTLRGLPEFERGHFFIQDESETLVVELLDPRAGETVLDLCAAPGGKACHIQERRKNQGTVTAVEVSDSRAVRIAENVKRLGLTGVSVMVADGRTIEPDTPFDRVLVDAPCSGLGVLARRADARWRKTEASMRGLLPLQTELLNAGARLVKPGGVLVYSVCSNEPEEGPRHIQRLLETDPRFTLEDASGYLPQETVTDGALQMAPHRHGTDGAFAARLRRNP